MGTPVVMAIAGKRATRKRPQLEAPCQPEMPGAGANHRAQLEAADAALHGHGHSDSFHEQGDMNWRGLACAAY